MPEYDDGNRFDNRCQIATRRTAETHSSHSRRSRLAGDEMLGKGPDAALRNRERIGDGYPASSGRRTRTGVPAEQFLSFPKTRSPEQVCFRGRERSHRRANYWPEHFDMDVS